MYSGLLVSLELKWNDYNLINLADFVPFIIVSDESIRLIMFICPYKPNQNRFTEHNWQDINLKLDKKYSL